MRWSVAGFVIFILVYFSTCGDRDEGAPQGLQITSSEFVDDLLFVTTNDFQIKTNKPATFSSNDSFIDLTSDGVIKRLTSAEVVAIKVVSKSDSTEKRTIYALGVKDDNYDPTNIFYNGDAGTEPYDSYLKGWKTLQKLPVQNVTYALVLRHADADQGEDWNVQHTGQGPSNWWISCDTADARQLNEKGRERARELGRIFKDLNYPIARVFSSEFCRAKESAQLINAGPTIRIDGRINHANHNTFGEGLFVGMMQLMKEQPVDNQMTILESHHRVNEPRGKGGATFPEVIPFAWTGGYFIKIDADKTITFEGAFSWGMYKYWRDLKVKKLPEQ